MRHDSPAACLRHSARVRRNTGRTVTAPCQDRKPRACNELRVSEPSCLCLVSAMPRSTCRRSPSHRVRPSCPQVLFSLWYLVGGVERWGFSLHREGELTSREVFFAREAENIRQGATEAGRLARALAVCSFAGACAVAPRRSPPSLQVMSCGGAMVYPGLSPPASAPGVLRWGRHPPNLPFPPTVRHSPWSRASP